MQAQGITPVFPVPNLAEAVTLYRALLGVEPSFVDGDRWAQFDFGGRRLALAGADRMTDHPALMIKVADLAAARAELAALGVPVGVEEEQGPHEIRCLAEGPGGWPLILYAPKPA